jgi:hypothetical protein
LEGIHVFDNHFPTPKFEIFYFHSFFCLSNLAEGQEPINVVPLGLPGKKLNLFQNPNVRKK